LQLQLVAQFISPLGKLNPLATDGAIFHFLVKRSQRPVKEDYGEKFFVIFYVPNHRQQTYAWKNLLVYGVLHPTWYGSHICGTEISIAQMSLILVGTMNDMLLFIFLKLFLQKR
jgi:hypothetical protein